MKKWLNAQYKINIFKNFVPILIICWADFWVCFLNCFVPRFGWTLCPHFGSSFSGVAGHLLVPWLSPPKSNPHPNPTHTPNPHPSPTPTQTQPPPKPSTDPSPTPTQTQPTPKPNPPQRRCMHIFACLNVYISDKKSSATVLGLLSCIW